MGYHNRTMHVSFTVTFFGFLPMTHLSLQKWRKQFSLFGLGVGSGSVLVQLLLEAILSFVPVKQSAQDGGEAVLSQRAHGAYQLREKDIHRVMFVLLTIVLAVNIPKQEIAIGVSFVYLRSNLNKNHNSYNDSFVLIFFLCLCVIENIRKMKRLKSRAILRLRNDTVV